MKKFIKFLVLALTFICFAFAVAGCGSKGDGNIVKKYEFSEVYQNESILRFAFKKGIEEQRYDYIVIYKTDFEKYECESLEELLSNTKFTKLEVDRKNHDVYYYPSLDKFFVYNKNKETEWYGPILLPNFSDAYLVLMYDTDLFEVPEYDSENNKYIDYNFTKYVGWIKIAEDCNL